MRPNNSAAKAYTPSWAKEKGEVVVWDFKEQEGNSHRDGKTNVW